MNGGAESPGGTAGQYDGNTVPAEDVFPGDADIVDAQYLLPPDVKDVNMFSFTLTQTGTVDLQTIAQRLQDPSLLQTDLRLFDSSGNELGENERYYGTDSYLSLTLGPGTYYIGVTSAGNSNYNPLIPDSGAGGQTQGNYELEIQFTPQQTTGLMDAAGVLFDGDDNYQPGGIYNFWFNTTAPNTSSQVNTIFVDKTPPTAPSGPLGSLTNPYTNLPTALAAANPGMIVRIEGNDEDGNPNNFADQFAYEIGYDESGNPLPDGTTLAVPSGVTVMIDAGAILKLHNANISVGTVSQGVSKTGGSLQVLGTPTQQVYFTSFNYTTTASGTAFAPTLSRHAPVAAGDWGGIVFYGDADHEADGIFDDIVNQATITYGGGQVLVNSQPLGL